MLQHYLNVYEYLLKNKVIGSLYNYFLTTISNFKIKFYLIFQIVHRNLSFEIKQYLTEEQFNICSKIICTYYSITWLKDIVLILALSVSLLYLMT